MSKVLKSFKKIYVQFCFNFCVFFFNNNLLPNKLEAQLQDKFVQ